MSEAVENQTDLLVDDELHILMREYSIPHVAEFGQDLMLSQSQYAKVIFHDIADTYPTDADICCRYSLTDGVTVSQGDRIALFRVGWSSVQEHIAYEWVPVTDATELQVLFKASSLPKDEEEFYQLCYVTINDLVCGASVPFQFRHPHENELCSVEEQDGMIVVRSRTAFTEEKLRQAFVANELLQKEKGNLQEELEVIESKYNKVSAELLSTLQKLSMLETEKKALDKKLEDYSHIERQVEQLQQDLCASDKDKNQTVSKLNKAEQHIQMLTATVDALSADKERMAQLLRNETQNRTGTAAEIIQYKDQVDSLTHMLEALTQSKELVAQELAVQRAANCELQEDIRNLEIARQVVQNDFLGLQEEEKILQERVVSAEKISEERAKQMNDLQKEKECLLSELVQAASKREKEIMMMTEVYEGRLKDVANKVMLVEEDLHMAKEEADERKKDSAKTAEMNKCLTQQLLEAQNKISEQEHSLAEITREKEILEADLWKIVESRRKLIVHNEHLTNRLVDPENESSPLNLQLQDLSDQLERKTHFRKVFIDLEHRISNLQIAQEEATADKNIQLERIDAITERLLELDNEEGKLQYEQEEVAAICDRQEKELTETINKLTYIEERWRKNYLMEDDTHMYGNFEMASLKEAVGELTVFVESSKMRMSEIDQRMKEIKEEKSVLMQQQSLALERKNEYKICEEEVYQELIELQEQEREMVYEWGGPMPAVQGQLDHSLVPEERLPLTRQERAELRQKLEETSSLPEQQCGGLSATEVDVCLEKEQQLKLRLQMAAEEYRKLYTEKQKVEKRLAKLYHRLNEKKAKSSSSSEQSEASSSAVRGQPMTGELICLSQPAVSGSRNDRALPLQGKGGRNVSSVCPVCNVEFPPGAFDLFRQHFDGHLS